jgi:hypothetical protein
MLCKLCRNLSCNLLVSPSQLNGLTFWLERGLSTVWNIGVFPMFFTLQVIEAGQSPEHYAPFD